MICKVLNLFYGFTKKVDQRRMSHIRVGLYFLIFFTGLMYASGWDGVHLLVKCVIGAGLMGLVVVFSIDREIKTVKWNKTLTALWFLLGALQLVSGVLTSVEYLPMALIWLVGFPALFLVWNGRGDYRAVFREVAAGGNICAWILILVSLVLVPIEQGQYTGMTSNPNGLGQWVTVLFPLVLFLHYSCTGGEGKKWVYRAELCALVLLCAVSQSRTAIVAAGAMCVIFALVRLTACKNSVKYYLRRGAAMALCFAIVAGGSLCVNRLVAASGSVERVLTALIQTSEPSEATHPTGQAKPVSPTQPTTHSGIVGGVVDRFAGADKQNEDLSLNDYSSGRMDIWRATLLALNWKGHPSREHIVTDRNGDVGSNVHNTVLQFAYDHGICAGVVFVILMAVGGITLLVRVLRRKGDMLVNGFCLTVHAGYCCTALLASLNLPFLYLIAFVYYLSFGVLLDDATRSV